MEKINVAEILKHCPTGMELDCTIFDDVHFDYIDDVSDIINCYIQDSKHKIGISFSKYGCYSNICKSKCAIFPKGKTTWEGFQRPFKDGDILVSKAGNPFILKAYLPKTNNVWSYCGIDYANNFKKSSNNWTFANSVRFATDEEKQKLFDAIKANGYKWNNETNTLEKLKKEKFDISTLKPFEGKVLVRDYNNHMWEPAFWGKLLDTKNPNLRYLTTNGCFKYCIPYEGNEHLLGKTDDCDEYYKTWNGYETHLYRRRKRENCLNVI